MKIKLKRSLAQWPVGQIVSVSDTRGRYLVAEGAADAVGEDGTVIETAVAAQPIERAVSPRQGGPGKRRKR